jgi:hypothetical protein
MQEEIQQLKRKIQELEKKIEDLNNPALIPESFIDALVKRGFLQEKLKLNYISASNTEFVTLFINHRNNTTALTGFDYRYFVPFTAATSDTCTSVGHSLEDDYQVYLITTGTLPAPLSSAVPYYVINASTNTFKLSASLGGAAVNITDTGLGAHYLQVQ